MASMRRCTLDAEGLRRGAMLALGAGHRERLCTKMAMGIAQRSRTAPETTPSCPLHLLTIPTSFAMAPIYPSIFVIDRTVGWPSQS
eukprot:4550116-Pyramimonas_sp.AAC.1